MISNNFRDYLKAPVPKILSVSDKGLVLVPKTNSQVFFLHSPNELTE